MDTHLFTLHTNHFFLIQAKFDSMKKQMESMEMEVMEARLIRASELNGEMDDDNTGQAYMMQANRLFYFMLLDCYAVLKLLLVRSVLKLLGSHN